MLPFRALDAALLRKSNHCGSPFRPETTGADFPRIGAAFAAGPSPLLRTGDAPAKRHALKLTRADGIMRPLLQLVGETLVLTRSL